MAYARKVNDRWEELTGPFNTYFINDEGVEDYYQRSADFIANHSDEELAELGIYPILPALETVPAGSRMTSMTLEDVAGQPRWVIAWEQIPNNERIAAWNASVDARFEQELIAGFAPSDPRFAGETLQCREKDQLKWLVSKSAYGDAIQMGASLVEGATFRCLSNNEITINYSDGYYVIAEMTVWGFNKQRNAWRLKNEFETALVNGTEPQIDIDEGW